MLVVIPNLSMQDPVSALIPFAPYYVLDTPMYTSFGYLQHTGTQERESNNDTGNEQRSLVKGGLAQRSGALLRGAGSSDGSRAGGSSSSGGSTSVLGPSTGKTEALSSSTSLHQCGGTRRDGRERITGDVPVGRFSWAVGCTSSGVVSSISGWGRGSSQGGLQSSVVGALGDRSVRVDGDQAVLAAFLRVLVNETARVDTGHLGIVESSNFLEFTGVDVATILGQARHAVSSHNGIMRSGSLQDGDTIAGEVLDLLFPAGNLEGRRITPRVVVESEEVAALIISTTVHVLGHLETVRVDISG